MNENYQTPVAQAVPPVQSYQPQYQPTPQYVYPQVNVSMQNSGGGPGEYSKTVSILDWFLYFLLTSLPFIGFFILIYYAIDKDKPSRANLARLSLIMMIILIVLAVIVGIVITLVGVVAANS